VTSIAAFRSGSITPNTTYKQQPAAEKTGLLVSGYRVRDGHHLFTGDKALDYEEAIEVSCNIYFALTGLRTGGAEMDAAARKLGFYAPIRFDLPTATSQLTNGGGPLPGGFADRVELANAAYGQGETLVTPLQMALVAATVADDGVMMRPHLVQSFTGANGTQQVGPSSLATVMPFNDTAIIKSAMERAVGGWRWATAGAPRGSPPAHRADRHGRDRRRHGRPVRHGRGRGLGRRRCLPVGHGRDRLPHDRLGWRPDAAARLTRCGAGRR